MKRVSITEQQYNGFLKKYEVKDDGKGLDKEEKVQVDNQFLGIELVDVKDTARKLISKAFRLGIKYAENPKDIYLRRKIKQKLDDMIQAVDGDKINVE